MLIIKVYCNDDTVDEIHIQNLGRYGRGLWKYVIRKPEGYDAVSFLHKRDEGWMPLVEKVLHYLQKVRPAVHDETAISAKVASDLKRLNMSGHES